MDYAGFAGLRRTSAVAAGQKVAAGRAGIYTENCDQAGLFRPVGTAIFRVIHAAKAC
jgi:hypothetical protein